jgi:hypothetical protein
MASDLATMLLSGNAAGVAMDPAMAQIAPDLQLAQAMTQQGISTAPAYPMQALGRLGQALAGAKIMSDATGQLQGIYGNAADAASRSLPQDHPLQGALKSPDPYARMVALQQYPKALLLLGEAKGVKPGEELRYPVPGTAPAAANTGGAAAAAEAAKNPALIARAGGIASAENPALIARAGATKAVQAPYEGGGDVVVQGPNGPVRIPATAATRAAIQPGGPQGVVRPPDEQVVGGPAAGIHVPGQAPAAGVGADNFAQRFAGVTGEPVKTPEFEGSVKGQQELYGEANKALGTVIGERITGGGKATYDKLNALDTMESALRTGGPNVITGPFAESILKGREALAGMGINVDWLKKGLPETEIISKMNAQLASASAKAMTGRPTQSEFNIWMRNNPGLVTSPQGTFALINVLRQQSQQDLDLSRLAMDKHNWDKWPQVEADYFKAHGLTNPLTGKLMRDEIAAARASGQGAPGVANTGGTPVPAVGSVVSGHRFLGGNPRDPKSWEQVNQGGKGGQ